MIVKFLVNSEYRRRIAQIQAFRRLWRDLGKNRIITIIPAEVEADEDPATGAGELKASNYIPSVLNAIFSEWGITHGFEVTYPFELANGHSVESLQNQLGERDVILLGGRNANPLTGVALELLVRRRPEDAWLLESCSAKGESPHWLRFFGTEKYFSKYSSSSQVGGKPNPLEMTEDYGIFVVRPNCFSDSPNPESRIILCFGAHTFGTDAAVNALFHPSACSELVSRLEKKSTDDWRAWIEGLVHVTGSPKLRSPERTVTVIAPEKIKGITAKNPPLRLLPSLAESLKYGEVQEKYWRYWLLAMYTLFPVAFALFGFGYDWAAFLILVVTGLGFVFQKATSPPAEAHHIQYGMLAEAAIILSTVSAGFLYFASMASESRLALLFLAPIFGRFLLFWDTQIGIIYRVVCRAARVSLKAGSEGRGSPLPEKGAESIAKACADGLDWQGRMVDNPSSESSAGDLFYPQLVKNLPSPPGLDVEIDTLSKQLGLRTRKQAMRVLEEAKLRYYFGGYDVACLETPEGLSVVASGPPEEVAAVLGTLSDELRGKIFLFFPSDWENANSPESPNPGAPESPPNQCAHF